MAAAGKRRVLDPRARKVVVWLATASVLALVILVGGAFMLLGGPGSGTTRPEPRAQAVRSADYDSALDALAGGDTTAAIVLLRKAAGAGDERARARLREVESARPSRPQTTAPVPQDAYTRAPGDVASLLPVPPSTYLAGRPETSAAGAIMSLQAAKGADAGVRIVVLSVLDKGDPTAAAAYVDGLSKAYPSGVQPVSIGARSGRFGTDGVRLAAVSFSRGRYAFDVVVTASSGDPAALKDVAVRFAASFPAAAP